VARRGVDEAIGPQDTSDTYISVSEGISVEAPSQTIQGVRAIQRVRAALAAGDVEAVAR
jgi:hypothetical protein